MPGMTCAYTSVVVDVREIASAIPNAQVVPMRFEPSAFVETPQVRNAIEESAPPQPQRRELLSGTTIILFADGAESTALTERLGDAPFREKARELDSALRTAISSNGGTAIEGQVLGDGVLATFGGRARPSRVQRRATPQLAPRACNCTLACTPGT